MVGCLSDPVTGAALYNIGHTEALPVLLLCVGIARQTPRMVSVALIWLAHSDCKHPPALLVAVDNSYSLLIAYSWTVSVDRMIGAELEYATGFADIHVGLWDGFRRRKV